jgi:hypothetical protein
MNSLKKILEEVQGIKPVAASFKWNRYAYFISTHLKQ